MADRDESKSRILGASIAILTRDGLGGWTIDEVARRAGCAKGLVNYHYKTKTELLDRSAVELLRRRRGTRLEALSNHPGGSTLDDLWAVLAEDVRSGRFAAAISLTASGLPQSPEPPGDGLRHAAARALDVPTSALPDDLVLGAVLDGLELQLLQGMPLEAVREAYHRLWLGLIET